MRDRTGLCGVAERRVARRPWIALSLILLLLSSGCMPMWRRIRERERLVAVASAKREAERGRCPNALESLDRAQARLDLGEYARQSAMARARCYERLELVELARGHRRLIQDFYTNEPYALPAPDGSSVFRVEITDDVPYDPPPSTLEIRRPRYTPYARRSKIVGRVVVAFSIAGNGRPTRIRTLEMTHPLLATWAMEAVSLAEPDQDARESNLMPGARYATTFSFEYHWAKKPKETP